MDVIEEKGTVIDMKRCPLSGYQCSFDCMFIHIDGSKTTCELILIRQALEKMTQ